MEDKDIFRTAVFGGYQKEDVTDYIRSLENENETIRILANKEKSDLKTQLEKEKAVSEGLKNSLAVLHDKISDLEKKQINAETHSPTVAETKAGTDIQTEEWKHRLDEERKALLDERQLWADNLAQLRTDMQNLWQNELQQFQRTLETIQEQLERSARDTAPANVFQQTQEILSDPDPAAAIQQELLSYEQPSSSPTEKPESENLSETDGSEKPSSSSELNEEQIHEYVLKTSSSINQTQKRASELLQKLDRFNNCLDTGGNLS